jgi:hypothetical protein
VQSHLGDIQGSHQPEETIDPGLLVEPVEILTVLGIQLETVVVNQFEVLLETKALEQTLRVI